MASVAELNHYPGPRQVEELAEALALTDEQKLTAGELYEEMHEEAVRLAKELVELEQKLNRIFAWGQASEKNVEPIVTAIGALQARIRFTHLVAHLRARALLTKDQVQRYRELRKHGQETVGGGTKKDCNPAHHHGG